MIATLRTQAAAALWRPVRAIRAAYVRRLIESAERDLFWAEQDLQALPLRMEVIRGHLSALRVRLIDEEAP